MVPGVGAPGVVAPDAVPGTTVVTSRTAKSGITTATV
jgi:hypothetical protein